MTTIDSFERSTLDYYSGTTGSYTTDNTRATDGTRSLYGQPTTTEDQLYSNPGDGLDYYPQAGDTIEWAMYIPSDGAKTFFGVQGTPDDAYGFEFGQYGVWIFYNEAGSPTEINWYDISGSDHYDAWTYHTLEWLYDSTNDEVTLNYTITDGAGTTFLDSTDTVSAYVQTSGGIGFGTHGGEMETWWDNMQVPSAGEILNCSGTALGTATSTAIGSLARGVSGTSTGVSTTTASLQKAAATEFTGTASGTGSTTATARCTTPVSATPTATASTTATPTRARTVSGSGTGVATTTTPLIRSRIVDGSLTGAATASATADVPIGLGASIAGVATSAADLGVFTDITVPRGVIDDFESDSLGYYSGDVPNFAIDTTRSSNGDNSLRLGDIHRSTTTEIWSGEGRDELYYPHAGDTIQWGTYYTEGDHDWVYGDFLFGGDDEHNCYVASIDKYGASLYYKRDDTYNKIGRFSTDHKAHHDQWVHNSLDWQYDDAADEVTFTYTMTDGGGTTLAQGTVTDTEFVKTSGGVGWAYESKRGYDENGAVWMDHARVDGAGYIEYVTASAHGAGTANGHSSVIYGVTGSLTGTGTADDGLVATWKFSGTAAGHGITSPTVTREIGATAGATGTATVTGIGARTCVATATATATGSAFGIITGPYLVVLRGGATGTGTVTPTVALARGGAASLTGTGTLDATPIRARGVSSSLTGTATATTPANIRERAIHATPLGTGTATTATLDFIHGLAGTAEGEADTIPTDLSWGPGEVYWLHTLTGTAVDDLTVEPETQWAVEVTGVAKLTSDPVGGETQLDHETLDAIARDVTEEYDIAVPVGGYLVMLSATVSGGIGGEAETTARLTAEEPRDAGFGDR